ncbi:MAG TPA: glycine zipper domain-containing protein [Gemmatimonas sp.]|nr:glycine zipper domain-containing protein [Gemmatimonas sp.]
MDNKDNLDATEQAARDRHDSTAPGFVSHEGTTGETVAGSVGGAAVGAAWGTLAGPLGTIIGGLAGAVGGWWAARSATEQHLFNNDDDSFYRTHHASQGTGSDATSGTGRASYDDVRPAYQIGHLAGTNPDYSSHSFDDVEPHLRSAYSTAGQNNWDDVRGYARDAYARGRTVGTDRTPAAGAHAAGGLAAAMGTSGTAGTIGTTGSMTDSERSLRGHEGGLVDRVADAADDLKDRVDGNPASRPGRDSTDRPTR